MHEFFQSGYAFLLAALLFLVVGAVSEHPAAYIGLGVAFLILGFAMRKKKVQKKPENTTKG